MSPIISEDRFTSPGQVLGSYLGTVTEDSSREVSLYDVNRLTFDTVHRLFRWMSFGCKRLFETELGKLANSRTSLLAKICNKNLYKFSSSIWAGFRLGIQGGESGLKFQTKFDEVNSTFDCDKCNLSNASESSCLLKFPRIAHCAMHSNSIALTSTVLTPTAMTPTVSVYTYVSPGSR